MMAAVLPVDEDSVDIDAIVQRMKQGIPPADVQEYLWRVRIEAEGIPDVVVSDVDPRRYDAKQTPNMPLLEELGAVSNETYVPTDSWRADLLAEFADLRQLLARWQEIGPPKRNEPATSVLRTQVPRMNDEDAWRVFFFGKAGGDHLDEADAADEPKAAMIGTPPHSRLLLQFDQVLTRRLLVYHTEWLDSLEEMSRARGVWIYALLARLDKPVHAEVAATIRQVLRRCWTLRNRLVHPSEAQLKTLNVIICITGEYFGQLDT